MVKVGEGLEEGPKSHAIPTLPAVLLTRQSVRVREQVDRASGEELYPAYLLVDFEGDRARGSRLVGAGVGDVPEEDHREGKAVY